MTRIGSVCLLVAWLLFSPAVAAENQTAAPPAKSSAAASDQGAKDLERHLIAPCCWRETLDVHTSPLTTLLRAEIRARLAGGESADQIESDLVGRYGPRLRANLPQSLGIWLAVLAGFAGGLLLLAFGRRLRKSNHKEPAQTQLGTQRHTDSDYEWQLDEDLEHD